MSGASKLPRDYSKMANSLNWLLDLKYLGENLAIDGQITFPIAVDSVIFIAHLMTASVSELLEYGQ